MAFLTPDPQKVPLAPVQAAPVDEDSKRIEDLTNQAVRSTSDIQKDSMAGVNPSIEKGQEDANRREMSLGSNDPGTSEAIRARYNTLLGNDLDAMKRQSEYQSYDTSRQDLNRAYGVAHAREQINLQNYARKMKAYNDNLKARAGVISTIFQTGGMIAGAALLGPAAPAVLTAGKFANAQPASGGAFGDQAKEFD